MNPFKKKELFAQAKNVARDINLISQYDVDELTSLNSFLDSEADFVKYNKLAFYSPHSYQNTWHEAAKHYRQRYLCAGNRLGKTFGMASEMASYLSGYYPDDWKGQKIDYDPEANIFVCIGIDHTACRKVLQDALIGTMDIRREDEIGTGTIPRECLDFDSFDKDGARLVSCRIAHHDEHGLFDGWNELHFYSASQGQDSLMGIKCKGVWIDECPPNEEELYSQAWTRCLTTNGFVAVTATPERGMTSTIERFMDDPSGYLYFQNVSMLEAPHLTPEIINEYLSNIPEQQKEYRLHGIPGIGDGAVYPFTEEHIDGTLSQYSIMEQPYRYKLLWGCDFGYSNTFAADPSTLMLCAYDTEEDVIYTLKEWNSKQDMDKDILSNAPDYMAKVIKESEWPNAPLVVPHDANKQMDGTNTTRMAEFKRLGINVLPKIFEIPISLTTGVMGKPSHPRSLEWTIQYMSKLFSENKLKIATRALPKTMSEYRKYHWNSNGCGKPVKRHNHHLDALRYAAVSIKDKGEIATRCLSSFDRGAEWSDLNNELMKGFSDY